MATIKDVAKLAKVSTATVSAALNGTSYVSPQLKDRVDRAVAELGYSTDGIARSLKRGKSNLIGLLVDDVTSPFYAQFIEDVESLAYDRSYGLLLCHTGRDVTKERDYLRLLRMQRVDGIIWAPTGRTTDYTRKEIQGISTPIIFVDRVIAGFASYDSVLLNNREAAAQATNYLLDLGHRRICMLSGDEFLEPARERNRGYREALKKRGVRSDRSLICNGHFREAEAFEEFMSVLQTEDITAVIAANNPMLIGVMRALDQFNLSCPKDMSVVAIDDFPLAGVTKPRMTTVRQPVREIAEQALRLLLRRMGGEKAAEPAHVQVEPLLIVRESCAPYKAPPRKRRPADQARQSA